MHIAANSRDFPLCSPAQEGAFHQCKRHTCMLIEYNYGPNSKHTTTVYALPRVSVSYSMCKSKC